MKKRKDNEFPQATEEWGWKFHHIGVPTNIRKKDESCIEELGLFVSGFAESPFGIEWMRFDEHCKIPELIQAVPHIAFVVDDLDFELRNRGFNILVEPNSPSAGVRVAMIEENGAPIELMEFK